MQVDECTASTATRRPSKVRAAITCAAGKGKGSSILQLLVRGSMQLQACGLPHGKALLHEASPMMLAHGFIGTPLVCLFRPLIGSQYYRSKSVWGSRKSA